MSALLIVQIPLIKYGKADFGRIGGLQADRLLGRLAIRVLLFGDGAGREALGRIEARQDAQAGNRRMSKKGARTQNRDGGGTAANKVPRPAEQAVEVSKVPQAVAHSPEARRWIEPRGKYEIGSSKGAAAAVRHAGGALFEEKMNRFTGALREQEAEGAKLDSAITVSLGELGYAG